MRIYLAALMAFIFLTLVPVNVFAASLRVPILTYHYIANNPNPNDRARDNLSVSPDNFEVQMDYLSKNGYTPISLDTLYAVFNGQASVAKPVVLTFDDGYIDFYTNAYPILRRFNFHAVSFIPTGLMGSKSYYMSWNQIKEIQASGLVTFEAHTVNHVNLPSYGYARVLQELRDSKNILQSQTGYPVNFVAYPNGSSNASVQNAARQAGLVGGLGTWYGKASGGSMNMPRIKVSGFWSIKEFASRL